MNNQHIRPSNEEQQVHSFTNDKSFVPVDSEEQIVAPNKVKRTSAPINFQQQMQPEVSYIDIDKIRYSDEMLMFLRKKLDDFTLNCLLMVFKEEGLHKTKIKDYHKHRKRYDTSFVILEAQGFIESKQEGISKPYFVTIRAHQLFKFIKAEKASEKI